MSVFRSYLYAKGAFPCRQLKVLQRAIIRLPCICVLATEFECNATSVSSRCARVVAVQALLMTSNQHKIAKCYEDIDAGRYRNRVSPSVVDAELQAAKDKQQSIIAAITASIEMSPDLRPALERILIRSVAVPGNAA